MVLTWIVGYKRDEEDKDEDGGDKGEGNEVDGGGGDFNENSIKRCHHCTNALNQQKYYLDDYNDHKDGNDDDGDDNHDNDHEGEFDEDDNVDDDDDDNDDDVDDDDDNDDDVDHLGGPQLKALLPSSEIVLSARGTLAAGQTIFS